MNYKSFNLGDWIGHISGVIEDETTLDGNEMRDLVEFLSTLEPCEDAISRQAALDIAFKYCPDDDGTCSEARSDLRNMLDEIEALPPAQPEQRWIPCSQETGDGYPEEDGFYYVTEQNYGFYLDADYKQRVTHTSHFRNGDFTDRFYAETNSNITAWMPLPEPYNAESEDKE